MSEELLEPAVGEPEVVFHPGGKSFKARLIHLLTRLFVWTTLSYWPMRGPLARLMVVPELVLRLLPRLRSTQFVPVDGDDWRAELVQRRGEHTKPGALLYLHGGAFLFCGLATHRRVVEVLALRTGLPVLSVQYRQLPVGLLDDSIADALQAYRWLVAQGHDPRSIVCVGDSAGGHLAFALALKLRELGLPAPAGVVGLSPWLDFDSTLKSAHPNARRDVMIPHRRLDRAGRRVTATPNGMVIDPTRSPVNAVLTGFPPVQLHCAQDEVLRHDSELMADRLAAAGVPCTLHIWEGQVHAFPVLADALPESRAANKLIAQFVADVVS